MADLAESLARRFEVLRPHLSELQRRLWLGAEAAELGAGGVAVVALAAGGAPDTVRRGRAEAQGLDAASVVRSRRPGGGRKRAEVHDHDLVAALEALIDPVTVSYTHLRAHETGRNLVCRLLLEKKKKKEQTQKEKKT